MALLFYDGFETASTNLADLRPGWQPVATNSGGENIKILVASAVGRSGGKAITASTANSTDLGGFNRAVPPSATLIVGVARFMSSLDGATLTPAFSGLELIQFRSDTGATIHLTIRAAPTTGQIELHLGAANGTVLATSSASQTLAVGAWFYIEAKATIADSGGSCVVRVNGVEWINFTGDTKNGGTSTNIDSVYLGMKSYDSGSKVHRADDLIILDTTGPAPYNDFIGDRTIRAIRPNGNGATNQWVGSDADSTDNYLLVDEDPFSSADYTGSPTVGDRDIYAFNDLSINGTVDAVQVLSYAAKSDAGARTIKTLTRSIGGTVLASSAAALQTTYGVVDSPILLTDADAAAWTVASVNSAQYGVEVGA